MVVVVVPTAFLKSLKGVFCFRHVDGSPLKHVFVDSQERFDSIDEICDVAFPLPEQKRLVFEIVVNILWSNILRRFVTFVWGLLEIVDGASVGVGLVQERDVVDGPLYQIEPRF